MSEGSDPVDLVEYVWVRHRSRMAELTDEEWRWLPTGDQQLGLGWRLDHIVEVLSDSRNSEWVGLAGATPVAGSARSAADALERGEQAFDSWRGLLRQLDDAALAVDLGPVAGTFAESSRRSFVLHVVDELIHHTAEAALLRDLHARR